MADFISTNTEFTQLSHSELPGELHVPIIRLSALIPGLFKKKRTLTFRARYISPQALRKKPMSKLKQTIFELFATRDLAPMDDREVYIKYSVRQFFLFLFFVVCVMIVSLHTTYSEHTYEFKKTITNLFINEGVNHMSSLDENQVSVLDANFAPQFWEYMQTTFINHLYWEYYYNQPAINQTKRLESKYNIKGIKDPKKLGIIYENVLMGVPRLRQIRVNKNHCPMAEDLANLERKCYPPYSEKVEDRGTEVGSRDKGILKHQWEGAWRNLTGEIREAYRYRTAKELNNHDEYWGELNIYSGNGAIRDLAFVSSESTKVLRVLKTHQWLDRSTRAIFIDFTVFNANTNLFCTVRILWEFPGTGGVFIVYDIQPMRLFSADDFYSNYVIKFCKVMVYILLSYYIIQETVEFIYLGWQNYFMRISFILDVLVIIMTLYSFSTQTRFQRMSTKTLKVFQKLNQTKFLNFDEVKIWYVFHVQAMSITIFICFAKLYKYLPFNSAMELQMLTLRKSAQDLLYFGVIFCGVFLVFSVFGTVEFGISDEDFRSVEDTMYSLLKLILGDFKWKLLWETSSVYGTCYFMAYIFFVFFIMMNMFLAILSDMYSEIRAEFVTQRNEFEVTDYLGRAIRNFITLFKKRNTRIDAVLATKLAAADGQLPFDEIRRQLEKSKFTDEEIDSFIHHNTIRTDRFIDEEEAEYFIRKIEAKHARIRKSRRVKANLYNIGTKTFDNHYYPFDLVYPGMARWTARRMRFLIERVGIFESMLDDCLLEVAEVLSELKSRYEEKESERRKEDNELELRTIFRRKQYAMKTDSSVSKKMDAIGGGLNSTSE